MVYSSLLWADTNLLRWYGRYQEFGSGARCLKTGDVVYIAPEVKHWYGVAKDEASAHISLSIIKEGSINEWCEPVSDEEYNKLK